MSKVQKILLVGAERVGKSSLIRRFSEDEFNDNYSPTVGIDFKLKQVALDSTLVKIQLWDTSGQRRFRHITKAYYKTSHAVVLVFDVTNYATFEGVQAWFAEICEAAPEAFKVLIGTKCDVADRVVTLEQAQGLARELGVMYVDASSKTNTNVDFAFFKIVCQIAGRDFAMHSVVPQPRHVVPTAPLPTSSPSAPSSAPATTATPTTTNSTSTMGSMIYHPPKPVFPVAGYLMKKGEINTAMQRRWFVLEAGSRAIVYYASHTDRNSRGKITLVSGGKSQCTRPSTFTFELHGAERVFTLQADSREEMEKWLNAALWVAANTL